MARVLVFAALAAVVFAIYAAVDCALTERERVTVLPRAVWILLILLLPVAGGVLWLLLGSGRAVRPPVRTTGPDDDPEFLRRAVRPRGPEEPDWKRLEQELVDPDDDGERRS